jgi:hypothetical protein
MTMAFFNSSSPAYKTAATLNASASAPSNRLASMFGSLLDGTSPAYKTLDGQAPQAPASSGLLRIFIGGAPSYKTASFSTNPGADDVDDSDDEDACAPPVDTVVVL